MAASSPDQFITLRPSMIVPIEPYLLLLRLEAAGFTFKLDADNVPLVAPFERLSQADLDELRHWRHHVAMLIAYVADDAHLFTDTAPAEPRRTA